MNIHRKKQKSISSLSSSDAMFVPLICLSFLFQLSIYDAAPTPSLADYLNPNESITDGEFLVSAGNDFALGFFSPGNSSYRYVGIWYYKIPKTTVVWVANRDNPINDSSGVVSFAQDGNLVVSSRSNPRQPLWSTNLSSSSNSTFLRLLDSGNLVLYMSGDAASDTTSSRVLWESFDHPAHILLSGMKLGLNRKTGLNRVLTSWKSKDDPNRGMYSFGFYSSFDSHGRSTEQFLYNGSAPVWRTGPWNGQRFSGASEMSQNNYLFNYEFVNNSDELYVMYSMNNSSIFSPFVLDYSGTVERLMWIERTSRWRTYYSAPKDNCDYYRHCGAYGSCRIADNALECSCLPGFEPKSPMDWYLRDWSDGCVRKKNLGCGNGDGFLTLVGVKLPDTSMATLVDKSLSVKECEQVCSKNCSCTAYAPADKTGGGSGCIAWFGELMDIRYFNEDGDNLYLRVDSVELAAHARKHKGFLHEKRNVIILTVSLVVTSLLLFAAFMHHLLKRRNGAAERSYEDLTGTIELQDDQTSPEIPFIELDVVAAITDNFSPSNLLGEGGFGAVYKGQLFNGKEVAIKRLSKNSGQGMEEFKNEVLLISKLQHRNLVRLLASCVHEEEKILIYEYMPNNSLDSFIFDKTKSAMLDWKKRFKIVDGIARGVLYLHHDSRLRIIHRDLKAGNVLLDDEMNPKISDFGMARIFGVNQVQANTKRIVGTYGYMSPEYAMHGIFSTKSDVFSFGVLLLEIITGKKNNVYFHEDPSTNLIEHVWELWKEGCALDLVDSSMNGSYPIHEVSRCIQVGLLCVQESASDRPNMSSVIFMLGSEIELPTPNRPGFIMKKTLKGLDSSSTDMGPCSINKMTTTMVEPR